MAFFANHVLWREIGAISTMHADVPVYQYRVDAVDRLVWVDPWWLAFARENGASELTAETVLGQSLWDFIADSSTRQLYQGIHQRLRQRGRPATLPFRCDSPTVRREMRLTITCESSDQLHYESTLLSVEPITTQKFIDPLARRSASQITMCSCCKQCLIESHGWLEPDTVARFSRIFEAEPLPPIRYALCPKCAELLASIPANGTAA
jgi:hypothetical protein